MMISRDNDGKVHVTDAQLIEEIDARLLIAADPMYLRVVDGRFVEIRDSFGRVYTYEIHGVTATTVCTTRVKVGIER